MTRRLFWTKFSLCQKQRIRSSSLSDFGQNKTFELRVNFSAELSKMHSTHSMESLGKNHLLKKNTFFIFTQNFEAVLSKLYSNCPEEHFEVYFWIFHFVPSFSDNEKKTVGRLSKTTQQCFKTWFLLVQGKNLRKVFFWSLLQVLPILRRIFRAFRRKKWGLCCQNHVLNVQRNISRERFLPKKTLIFFYQFQLLSWNFSAFCRKFSAGLSKLQSTYPLQLFKENTLFWKNYVFFITVVVPAEIFGFFAKRFRPFRENCFRRVQQKNLRKTIFNTVGVRAKTILTVDGKFSAVLSKLLPTSPEESFAGLSFYTLTS